MDQMIAMAVVAGALVLFAWGRLRYDLVAILALLAVTLTGLVSPEDALAGFGHPAVITVAAVLLISHALYHSGTVDALSRLIEPLTTTTVGHIFVLSGAVAIASAFMNNVGALAIFLPIAMQSAKRRGRSPAILLMPLAFGSLLGGLVTLIGTPPNIIIASFRKDVVGEPFGMFDFSPVGAPTAIIGVLFLALAGWRLIPKQRRAIKAQEKLFQIEEYTLEVRIGADSPLIGSTLRDAENVIDEAIIAGFVRGDGPLTQPAPWIRLRADDVLVLEGDPADLKPVLAEQGFELLSAKGSLERLRPESVDLIEAVVQPHSALVGETADYLLSHTGLAVRLLAIARSGEPIRRRLSRVAIQASDVMLLQVEKKASDIVGELGLLPLPQRNLRLHIPSRVLPALAIFGGAIALSTLGWVPTSLAFLSAVILFVLIGILPARGLYESIDWPIILLLAGMIPVGQALQDTGATRTIADGVLSLAGSAHPAVHLTLLMFVTMKLSNVINNAAAALIMAPIAVAIAQALGVSVDSFLMGVAIGASCAFLTPIGHQSNTLVMGPAGYRFSDYWPMGLPLEIVVLMVSVPMILTTWPLHP